ncbi:MAG TPA: hypothetical protein VIW69_15080, partial [Candidatus Elarobacter sp.]
KWDAALMSGKLLSADDLATMLRPGRPPAVELGPKAHYGYGWAVDAYEGQSRVRHSGNFLGFSAANQIYPSLSETIIVLTNQRDLYANDIANAVFNALHPALAAAAKKPAAGEDPNVTARLKRVWDAFVSGAPDRSELSGSLNAELTPAVLTQLSAEFKAYGAPTAWTYTGSTVNGVMKSYTYRVHFATGNEVLLTMSLGRDGKITDISPSSYAGGL